MFDTFLLIASLFFSYTTADLAALDPCTAQSEDACLSSVNCDVFVSDAGDAVCGIACDQRFTASMCAQDSACSWENGACGYVDDGVPGC